MSKERLKDVLLKSLAHPVRRTILRHALQAPCHPDDLTGELKLTRATIESHIKQLQDANLVKKFVDPASGKTFISITPLARSFYLRIDRSLEAFISGEEVELEEIPILAKEPKATFFERLLGSIRGISVAGLACTLLWLLALWITLGIMGYGTLRITQWPIVDALLAITFVILGMIIYKRFGVRERG